MLKFSGWPRLTWGRGPREPFIGTRRRGFLAWASWPGERGVQRCAFPSTTRRVRPDRRPALRPAVPQGTVGHYPHP
jgi:hypothetical protein